MIKKLLIGLLLLMVAGVEVFAQGGVSVLTNKSGGVLAVGSVVIVDTSTAKAFTTTTTSRAETVVGVVARSIADNATGLIYTRGSYVPDLLTTGVVTIGDFLVTSTTAARAASGGTTNTIGAFAIALEASGGGSSDVAAILLAFSASSGDLSATAFLPSGLVGWWPLNEGSGTTANDLSVNTNTGTITAGAGGYSADSPFRESYDFDGADTKIDAGSDSSLDDFTTMTFAAWVKADGLGEGSAGRIFQKSVKLFYTQATEELVFSHTFTGTDGAWSSNSNALTNGAWHHVAVTYDNTATGNVPVMYVDGQSITVNTDVTPTLVADTDAAGNFIIGNDASQVRTWDGHIAEVMYLDRILTAEEVQRLFVASSESPTFQTLSVTGGFSDVGVEDTTRGTTRHFGDSAGLQGVTTFENGGTSDTITEGWAFGGASGSPDFPIIQFTTGANTFNMSFMEGGGIQIRDQNADPSNPPNGTFVFWMSDGTAAGDDGDLMIKITDSGGTTKTITWVDYSAF